MRRERIPELMDQPDAVGVPLRQALAGLGRVHLLTRTAPHVWKSIRTWAAERGVSKIQALDIACGRGDVLCALSRYARRDGFDFRGVGIDRNESVVSCAREFSRGCESVTFHSGNALSFDGHGYNVIFCTLFLHHLSDVQACQLLSRMTEKSEGLVLIHDLLRSRAGYFLARLGTRALSRSRMVREDGPRSVRSAFTSRELANICSKAGLQNCEIRRVWPNRLELTWERQEGFFSQRESDALLFGAYRCDQSGNCGAVP